MPEWTDPRNWAAVADPADLGDLHRLSFRPRPEIFVAQEETGGSMFTHDEMRIKVRFIYTWAWATIAPCTSRTSWPDSGIAAQDPRPGAERYTHACFVTSAIQQRAESASSPGYIAHIASPGDGGGTPPLRSVRHFSHKRRIRRREMVGAAAV